MSSVIARDASIMNFLKPYERWLHNPNVKELAVNKQGTLWFQDSKWNSIDLAESATTKNLEDLGVAVATYRKDTWNEKNPILSASMPDGSRIQLVMPPAVESDCISFTLRRPSKITFTLDDFEKQGMFKKTVVSSNTLKPIEVELKGLLKEQNFKEFIRKAVTSRRNIVCCGATGSGKTTFMKGIVQEIPLRERLITIEDVRELFLPHENTVHLIYSGSKDSSVTPKDLLKSCLRMKPDRILLAELRSEECLYFIRSAASGHPGSITSLHAESPALAMEQMAIMIKESTAGASLDSTSIRRLLALTIDVIIQFQTDDETDTRWVSEIYYEPEQKYKAML